MARFVRPLIKFLGSFGLAIVLMALLLLLTFLGTIDQTRLGLYEVQRRYFTSFFFMYEAGPIRFPLPGVYLLSVIFCINIICGGVMRLRRTFSNLGLFIIHGGMLYLMLAALVTHEFAIEGNLALDPGQTGSTFDSYHDWELVAAEVPPADATQRNEHVVPQEVFNLLRGNQTRAIGAASLPFEIVAGHYERNAQVLPKGPMFEAPLPVVDGFFVMPKALVPENEQNLPALYVTLKDKATGKEQREILWGASLLPLTFVSGGKNWTLELRRQSWTFPFSITLKEFRRQLHPNTPMARSYESDVLLNDGPTPQPVRIRMNEPLRHRGYTFFQASFVENKETGTFTSVFAVVRNPADHWPLYALIAITVGMLVHFGMRLAGFLRREKRATTPAPAANPSATA